MANKELDKLIESYFTTTKAPAASVSFEMLVEMIEETIGDSYPDIASRSDPAGFDTNINPEMIATQVPPGAENDRPTIARVVAQIMGAPDPAMVDSVMMHFDDHQGLATRGSPSSGGGNIAEGRLPPEQWKELYRQLLMVGVDSDMVEAIRLLADSGMSKEDLEAMLSQQAMQDARGMQQMNEKKEGSRTRTYTIKEIPYIPISELGWANNEDGAQGPTQRSQLEGFIRSIGKQGDTLENKLASVSQKMTEGFGEIPAPEDAAGSKEYIQKVMAYLVFYKSLTMAITNFNASAAGFNFEAFLAALMGGEQIPAAQEGDSTIADFTTAEGIPISLKLYTEGSLKVGGSFTDLVHDMVNPKDGASGWVSQNPEFMGGAMRYVVCTKEFGEEDPKGDWKALDPKVRKAMDQRELHGKIRFWEFDITRSNLFERMAPSSHGKQQIISSQRLMEAISAWKPGDPELAITTVDGDKLPQRSDDSEQAIAGILAQMKDGEFGMTKKLLPSLKKLKLDNDAATAVMDKLYQIYSVHTLEPQIGISERGERFMTYHIKISDSRKSGLAIGKDIQEALVSWPEAANITKDIIKNAITPWWVEFKEGFLKKIDVRTDAINAMDWVTDADQLVEWYNGLGEGQEGAERRRMALLNTRGYLTTGNWEIGDSMSKSMGTRGAVHDIESRKKSFPPFATIEIGAPAVTKVLNQVRNRVMEEVFAVFENIQHMSENLNTFFANGLTDAAGTGKAGVEAGESAAKDTRKLGNIKKDSK